MAGIEVNMDTALAKYQEIVQYDEIIAAASGSKDAGKRAIANQIAVETETDYKKMLDNLVSALNKVEDTRVLVGVTTAINKSLKDNFTSQVEEFLEKELEARKSDTPEVSQEQLEQTLKDRKEAVDQYNALKNILEMFGNDVESLPVPKRMSGPRGAQGKRGPRLPKNLQFQIDGKDRTATQNSLSSIANTVCKGDEFEGGSWTTKELKTWLMEQGFDFENPPTEFSYTLPNGKVLSGYMTTDPDEDEDEDEDETEVEE